jgi:hypothetical protein
MEVRLPSNVIDMIEHEYTWDLVGHLGADENGQSPRIGVHSEVISLEELAA